MKPLNWKKNFFSYAVWLIGLLLTGYGILTLAGLRLVQSGDAATYGVCGGVLLTAGLLNVFVWFFRKKRQHRRRKHAGNDLWLGLGEKFLFLVIVALGAYFRWTRLSLADGGGYFEAAMVKAGRGLPLLQHGAGSLYVLALHGICFVLGNNLMFCAWFQLLLELLAGIFCLLGIRRLTGSFSALLFAACYFLSPGLLESAAELGPEPLFLLFFGIGLALTGGFLKKASGLPLNYLLTGAVIGFLVYLDISGMALLGILITVLYVEREEPERFWNGRILSLLIALAGFGAALAGSFAADAYYSAVSVQKAALAWSGLYLTAGNPSTNPLRLVLEMEKGQELAGLLFLLMAVGIFSFFFKKRQERTSVWILAGGILFLLEVFGMISPVMNGREVFLLCLCALAGTALSNYGREKVLEKAKMRRWDPSLYGIVEDAVENKITEDGLAGQYSEGESENNGYTGAENPESGYTEGEYPQDDKEEEHPAQSSGTSETEESAETASSDAVTGNFITRIFQEKNRKKAEQRQEMEKVLSALSAISEDTEVSISPDHKPGEELVKIHAKDDRGETSETTGTAESKKRGLLKRKGSQSAAESTHAPEEQADSLKKTGKAQTGDAEEGSAPSDDGRKPLHNPLPLPKKKTATMLEYDYEVSDDDDYDYD